MHPEGISFEFSHFLCQFHESDIDSEYRIKDDQVQCVCKFTYSESIHVEFVVAEVVLGQVFSEYVGFTCQSSFHQFLHNHPHLSSGAGTTSSSGRSIQSLTAKIKKKKIHILAQNNQRKRQNCPLWRTS
jgi:hypothetical protein